MVIVEGYGGRMGSMAGCVAPFANITVPLGNVDPNVERHNLQRPVVSVLSDKPVSADVWDGVLPSLRKWCCQRARRPG